MTHTPTPWSAHSCDAVPTDDDDGHRFVDIIGADFSESSHFPEMVTGYIAHGTHIASVWGQGTFLPTREANAARIVACVNACDGIADPSVVPELLAALGSWIEYDDMDEADFSGIHPMVHYAKAINATRAAIAKAKGE